MRTEQATSTATFFVTGTGCPPAPAEFVTSGSSLPPVDTSSSAATGSGSDSQEQQDTSPEVTPAGLSVALRNVLSQRSAAPSWDLQMEPQSSNVTLKPGNEGSVNFRLSWSKAKSVGAIIEPDAQPSLAVIAAAMLVNRSAPHCIHDVLVTAPYGLLTVASWVYVYGHDTQHHAPCDHDLTMCALQLPEQRLWNSSKEQDE